MLNESNTMDQNAKSLNRCCLLFVVPRYFVFYIPFFTFNSCGFDIPALVFCFLIFLHVISLLRFLLRLLLLCLDYCLFDILSFRLFAL